MTEPSGCGGDAALCQINLITCYYKCNNYSNTDTKNDAKSLDSETAFRRVPSLRHDISVDLQGPTRTLTCCKHFRHDLSYRAAAVNKTSNDMDRRAVPLRYLTFLANVNSRSRSLYGIARPSVCRLSVCNALTPYSGG